MVTEQLDAVLDFRGIGECSRENRRTDWQPTEGTETEALHEGPGPLMLRDWDCEAAAAWEAGRSGPREGCAGLREEVPPAAALPLLSLAEALGLMWRRQSGLVRRWGWGL